MLSKIVTYKIILPNTYHFQFPNDYYMISSLLRFQEHYESSRFCDKVFTLEEYMDYYANRYGNFTYLFDVAGMNFPSSALDSFYKGYFDPLSYKEKKFLDLFDTFEKPFYFIATSDESENLQDDIRHEISHALFYLNPNYKKEISNLLKRYKFKEIKKYLRKEQYHKSRFHDEIQALLLEKDSFFEKTGIHISRYKKVRFKIKKIFNKYFQDKKTKKYKFKI